jgi:DNA-binding response OmpR family regulator
MSEVLLVEDEVLIAELVEDALRDSGFEVATTHTGREAFARLEAEPRSFAVVVTDINLGEGVTGFDVAARARALNPAIKVVYVTGLPSNIYSAEEEALMFPKPFDPFELADQVRALVGRSS